jgi:Glycoside-hydrolase family GH114
MARHTAAALAALFALTVPNVGDAATPAQQCASKKIRAAGKKASCLLALDAKVAAGSAVDPTRFQKCKDRLGDPEKGAFAHAERRGGCLTPGDAPSVESTVDSFVDDVVTALDVGTPSDCQAAKLRAAGKKAGCLLNLRAKAAAGHGLDAARVQRCMDRMSAAFDKAEAGGGCGTMLDAGAIESTVDTFVDAVVAAEPAVATCALAGCPPPVACDTGASACWQPSLADRWQYQLQAALTPSDDCRLPATGGIDTSITHAPSTGGGPVAPHVFDIDFLVDPVCAAGGSNDVDNTAAVSAIHANGAKAICYVDAGTDEPFRPDHQAFVDFDSACGGCLLGDPVGGFREEHWLNIENDQGQRDFVLGMAAARVDRCKADGFDAVEFDNVEAYANKTGLPISEATQLLFNTALANLAHARGLTVALKNDLGQIGELVGYFDMAVNEQCQQYEECDALDPFLMAGKAVFQVEYQVAAGNFCPPANSANRSAIAKTVDLFELPWTPCR